MGVFEGDKFVIYNDKRNGRQRDMSFGDWESAMRDPNRKRDTIHWELVRVIEVGKTVPVVEGGGIERVEVEDDKLECPLCGHIAKDDGELKRHKLDKHS